MIDLSTVIIAGVICVIVEAFFSGSEIAMVSVSRVGIRQRAAAGDRRARMVEDMLARPQILIATTLLGTNIAAVSFSVVVAIFLIGAGWTHSELYAVLMVTPTTLILGEVVPKTIFQQHADALAPRVVYPLMLASLALRPLAAAMAGFAGLVSRVRGGDQRKAFVTREELLLLIEDEVGRSEITQAERDLISNVLEARGLMVADVMVSLSEVTALPADSTLAEAARVVADKQHSRMPIYRERVDDVIGVLHVFDLIGAGPASDRLVSELSRAPVFVPERKPAVDLLDELKGSGQQMAIVVDEYGGAIGIVTIEDLVEEIIGAIEDEHDAADPPPIRNERPGVWRAEGRTTVARVNAELGLELPESDDYETLAGLVLDRMKRIPTVGESIVVGNLTLRVSQATGRAVEEVQILRRRKR